MKEIKKMIDTSKLTPAPLDNKNVMLDWWEENMFDDETMHSPGIHTSDSLPVSR